MWLAHFRAGSFEDFCFLFNYLCCFQISYICRNFIRHFSDERPKVGLLGLYPKYELYVRPMSLYHSLMGVMYVHMTVITEKAPNVNADDRKLNRHLFRNLIFKYLIRKHFQKLCSFWKFVRFFLPFSVTKQNWDFLSKLYEPWICPLQMTEEFLSKARPPKWIQDLADGQGVLQPWGPGFSQPALSMIGSFVEVIQYMHDTLPGQFTIRHAYKNTHLT